VLHIKCINIGSRQPNPNFNGDLEWLKERTPTRVPLDWATTKNNLGEVFLLLADQIEDKTLVAQAQIACSQALEVYERSRSDRYIEAARENLERANAILENLSRTR